MFILILNKVNPIFVLQSFRLCFSYDVSGNEALATSLSEWVFKMRGVLRSGNIVHHRMGEVDSPYTYTVMDEVVSKRQEMFGISSFCS